MTDSGLTGGKILLLGLRLLTNGLLEKLKLVFRDSKEEGF
jgi:hypothetical protein